MAKQLVIVGSGPVGLEMAVAALKEEGNVWNVTVLEKGEKTSQNVRDWGFVTLFFCMGAKYVQKWASCACRAWAPSA